MMIRCKELIVLYTSVLTAILLGGCAGRSASQLGPPETSPPITATSDALSDPSGRKTLVEAVVLIRADLQKQKPALDPGFLLPLQEVPVKNAWDVLHIQVFRVKGGIFADESFLIRDGSVLALGTAFGGRGVTSLLLSDLDEDGIAELLFAYSFGSGLHQSRIGMFAPAYSADNIIDAELVYYGDLSLFEEDLSLVRVSAVEGADQNLPPGSLIPIGTLAIEDREGQAALVLRVAGDLPEDVRGNLITGPQVR